MSMFPPFFRGGIVECPPGSSSAVPRTPGNGASGTATRAPERARIRANAPSSRFQIWRKASGNSASGRSPRPGRMWVQPNGAGSISTISTTRTSPGRAPRTAIGPVRGWPFMGPRAAVSRLVDVGV